MTISRWRKFRDTEQYALLCELVVSRRTKRMNKSGCVFSFGMYKPRIVGVSQPGGWRGIGGIVACLLFLTNRTIFEILYGIVISID